MLEQTLAALMLNNTHKFELFDPLQVDDSCRSVLYRRHNDCNIKFSENFSSSGIPLFNSVLHCKSTAVKIIMCVFSV